MGFHKNEYISEEEGKQLGLRNMDTWRSSGDVTLSFSSGRSWVMPDMARLYVELGWVPPREFVDDVMNSLLVDSASRPQPVGYLHAKNDPLPRPFKVSDELPKGFLQKLEGLMAEAASLSYRGIGMTGRAQTNSAPPKPKVGRAI